MSDALGVHVFKTGDHLTEEGSDKLFVIAEGQVLDEGGEVGEGGVFHEDVRSIGVLSFLGDLLLLFVVDVSDDVFVLEALEFDFVLVSLGDSSVGIVREDLHGVVLLGNKGFSLVDDKSGLADDTSDFNSADFVLGLL